jgi:deoxyribodipyrimidine photo-lyase
MNNTKILIWYRNDLRIHDHELLYKAVKTQGQIIPFYCFDERQFGVTSFGFPKTGSFRAKFLVESITNLRESLQKLGSDLIVRKGLPEEIIPEICQEFKITTVYFFSEVTSEEITVEKKLKFALKQNNIKVKSFWNATLYHVENLPFDISEIPELFTTFRKQIEKCSLVEDIFPTPKQLPKLPDIDTGIIPTLTDLGLEIPTLDNRAVLQFKGGETEALRRLNDYFWESDNLKNYKETRNQMLGANYSSKFSPWLANGCLSPRLIYHEVKKYETERVKNDSTYWLIFELLWRDYFRFITAKHGKKIFYQSGLRGLQIKWQEDWTRFNLWCEGKTGFPLIDANMRELKNTGFMSNRGRQNVASFLTKNLGINWQMGAEWFESLLIDYDVCSNYGNWNYTAGVGNDARGFRYFNIPKQSKDYDSQGIYVKHWLPELSNIPPKKVHQPWTLSLDEQKRYSVIIGVDYPHPIVDLEESVITNEKIYNAAFTN